MVPGEEIFFAAGGDTGVEVAVRVGEEEFNALVQTCGSKDVEVLRGEGDAGEVWAERLGVDDCGREWPVRGSSCALGRYVLGG